jgi:molybdate transport system permease protein
MAFPLMVRSLRVSFVAVDPRLERMARTLGAGPLAAFLSVTLPLSRNGVIAACVLAFARSLGEFGATIMIAGSIPGETRTIPLEIYGRLASPSGGREVVPLILVAVALSAIALIISEALQRRTAASPPDA